LRCCVDEQITPRIAFALAATGPDARLSLIGAPTNSDPFDEQ
jgi:hypothetical protein